MIRKMHRFVQSPLIHRVLVTLFGFTIYLRTLAPTVMWYDMGEYQTAAYFLGVAHNTGYPLYLLLGKIFTFLPVGDPAFRVNVMSAFFGAGTLFLTHLLVFRLTDSKIAAFLTALTLSVTSTLWSNATWAEVYTLNAFLSLLIIFLFVIWLEEDQNWQINLAVGVFGLSLGNHRLILAVGLGLGLVYLISRLHIQKSWSWREVFRLLGFFVLGFSIHLYLPIRSLQNPPVLWIDASQPSAFFKMITTGYASSEAFFNPLGDLTRLKIMVKMLVTFPVYEWTAVGLVLGLVGAYRSIREHSQVFLIMMIIVLLTGVMVSVYGIHDIFNYYHPIYLMVAIWFGIGTAWLLSMINEGLAFLNGQRFWILGPAGRRLVAVILLLLVPLTLAKRNYDLVNKSQHRDARDFALYLLNRVEPGSVILADFWTSWPLKYVQLIEGVRRDVQVFPAFRSGSDQTPEEVAAAFLERGFKVYYTQRDENDLGGEIGSLDKVLVAPYAVHSMTTDVVPAPEYKDLLVPRGAVFRLLNDPEKALSEERFTQDVEIAIGEDLVFKGLVMEDTDLHPGEPFQIQYGWELKRETDHNYWVDVLFADEGGGVATVKGFPVWLHSHWVGGGSHPTSEWLPGRTLVETYDGIVPRRVNPGKYQITLVVYRDAPRENFQPARGPSTEEGKILMNTVTVYP